MDSTWFTLAFRLKPGSEDTVAKLFEESGRPEHQVLDDSGAPVGRLLRTLVFVGKELAIRVIEVEGDIFAVAGHMSRQQETKELEAALEPFLAEPRDMSTPEGAMAFYASAGMRNVLHRRHDD
jgi:hypothetical protein